MRSGGPTAGRHLKNLLHLGRGKDAAYPKVNE